MYQAGGRGAEANRKGQRSNEELKDSLCYHQVPQDVQSHVLSREEAIHSRQTQGAPRKGYLDASSVSFQ